MDVVEEQSLKFLACMDNISSLSEKKSKILEYVVRQEEDDSLYTLNNSSELFSGLQCVNYQPNLEESHLSGKLVLLDFFTYCCINCIHIMPFLHDLESKFKVTDGLVIIGVHSAKFPNEKVEDNIKKAIDRYDISHPVVNDSDIKVWMEFGVKCWPTLILISPNGKVLFSIAGESHTAFVELFVEVAYEFFVSKCVLNKEPLPLISIEALEVADGQNNEFKLNFPGKIAIDDTGNRIAISDSGNNRIIISDSYGNINAVVGETASGFVDGSFKSARFNSPQGLCWYGQNAVFVADCNNHSIRKIDLLVKRVVTVCGTGVQGNDLEGGKPGLDQPLSSPWDVVIGGSPRESDSKSLLYIAMSGCHQIWTFFLKNSDFQKGVELDIGTCIRYAGSGNEENRSNTYPHKAGFAQPSGLTHDVMEHALYIADSESSTIRKMLLTNGNVQAVVGGDIDPMNLFAFGDADGKGRNAKLQHPIGIQWDKMRNVVYVADTYNHKIRTIDPKKKLCTTLQGMVNEDGKSIFSEPSGLAMDPSCQHLYVADTNNHEIKVISLENLKVDKFSLKFDSIDTNHNENEVKLLTGEKMTAKMMEPLELSPHQDLRILLSHGNFHLNADAPSAWQITYHVMGEQRYHLISKGDFLNNGEVAIPLKVAQIVEGRYNSICQSGDNKYVVNIIIESMLYYCLENSDVCKMLRFKTILPLEISYTGSRKRPAVVDLPVVIC